MPENPSNPLAAVEYRDVSYRYPGATATALERVSLRVEQGERLGILGPNGAGKSTLLKLTLGLLPVQSGEVLVYGRAPEQARRDGLIGYMAQRTDCELRFPLSVRQVIALGAGWRTPAWRRLAHGARENVARCLSLVGAEPFADRPIGRLSGGQLQRAMIARALAANPKILVLDEPTVGIDAPGQRQFAEMLARVHRELGVTILIVSHNLRAIAAGCDRVACLARRLHSHVTPQGLTPQVLGELFSHDVEGLFGEMHVHAHAARDGACCAEEHSHTAVPVEGGASAAPSTQGESRADR